MGEPMHKITASSQRCEPGSVNIRPSGWPSQAKQFNGDTVATSQPPATSRVEVDATKEAEYVIRTVNEYLKDEGTYEQFISTMFHEDGMWRDHLALSWDLRTLKGPKNIMPFLDRHRQSLKEVRVDDKSNWCKPKVLSFSPTEDLPGIQFYITLDLTDGAGRGMVRLVKDGAGKWKIWTFFTTRESIKGHEELVGARRPKGVQHGGLPGRKNWRDRRLEAAEFVSREPAVLIVGAGQAGLTAHARLKMLNVPTLIVDQNDRVGDNWRKRYHQLVLHDPVWYDHLPYLKFPDNWPVFTPKDKLADWFESYASALELNVWMKSSVESSSWDEAKKEWTVTVKRTHPDGRSELRTLHPKHVIQATGHSGKKHFPSIPGREQFEGLLCHSSDFPGAKEDGKGRKAVVIGACNSSHDICQDYYERGYEVTMVQRSSTCVVSSEAATEILLAGLYGEGGPPTEDADVWLWSWPAQAFKTVNQELTKRQMAFDATLHDGLERAGFQLDHGPDDAGLFIKYFQRGGGYYFDVGASQLIIDGKIRVKQGQEVAEILPRGVRMADGTMLEADEVVFATGYENMRTQARIIFGDEVADRVGDIWGFDQEGEVRALWRPSGHPGFWFHGGNLAVCRYYSRLLALQVKARLEGVSSLVE